MCNYKVKEKEKLDWYLASQGLVASAIDILLAAVVVEVVVVAAVVVILAVAVVVSGAWH